MDSYNNCSDKSEEVDNANSFARANSFIDPLIQLPCELQSRILGLLDIRSLAACRLVSNHWLVRVDDDSHLWSAVGLRMGLRRRPSRDCASDRRFVQETASKCRLSCAWIDCAEGEFESRSDTALLPFITEKRSTSMWRLVCLRACQLPGRQARLHLWHYASNTGRLSEADSCQSARLRCPAGSVDDTFSWWPGALSSGCHVGGHLGCLADCGGVACAVAQPTGAAGSIASLVRLPLEPFYTPTMSKWSILDLTGCSGRRERLAAIAVHTCSGGSNNNHHESNGGRRNSFHSRSMTSMQSSTSSSCQVALGLTASDRLMAWIASDKASSTPEVKTPIAASLQLTPLASQKSVSHNCEESKPSQCRLWCLPESYARRRRRCNLRRRRVSLATLMPTSMSPSSQPRRTFVVATLSDGSAAVAQIHCACCCYRGEVGGDSKEVRLQHVVRIGGDDLLVRDILPNASSPPPSRGFLDTNEYDRGDSDDDCVGFKAIMTSSSKSTDSTDAEPIFWLREFICRDDCKPPGSEAAVDARDTWICRTAVAYQLPSNYERLMLCAAGRTFLCLFASHWSAGAALLIYRRATAAPLCVVDFPQYADTFPRYELHPPVWVNQAWFDRGIASDVADVSSDREVDSEAENGDNLDDESEEAVTKKAEEDGSATPQPLLLFSCPVRGFSRCLLLSCSRLGGSELDVAMATSVAAEAEDTSCCSTDSKRKSGLRLVACSGLDFNGCEVFSRRRSAIQPH